MKYKWSPVYNTQRTPKLSESEIVSITIHSYGFLRRKLIIVDGILYLNNQTILRVCNFAIDRDNSIRIYRLVVVSEDDFVFMFSNLLFRPTKATHEVVSEILWVGIIIANTIVLQADIELRPKSVLNPINDTDVRVEKIEYALVGMTDRFRSPSFSFKHRGFEPLFNSYEAPGFYSYIFHVETLLPANSRCKRFWFTHVS